MGQRPSLKVKTRALLRRQQVLKLISEGRPVADIAEQMGLQPYSVRRHMHVALKSESIFPNSLNGDQVGQLRQTLGERLNFYNEKLVAASKRAEELLKDKNTEIAVSACVALARINESAAKVSSELSKLFGLYAPTKIIEESMRLNFSKSESKITITFDPKALMPSGNTVPGLMIGGNGNSIMDALPNVPEVEAEVSSGV